MRLPQLLLAAVPVAWLVPNHYHPWPAAWPDGLALALLALAAVSLKEGLQVSRIWFTFVALALTIVAGQLLTSQILFAGDATMAALYIAAFGASIALGQTLSGHQAKSPYALVDGLAVTAAMVAVLSVGIALAQWTSTAPQSLWLVDKSPVQRPFANIAQPNHFCTLSFLGFTALGWLRRQRKIGGALFCMTGAWLLLGMVLSGSRTGWLQVLALLGFVAIARIEVADTTMRRQVLALIAFYVALTLAWPSINDGLLLQGSRPVEDVAQGGTRLAHWFTMTEALARSPWKGYGWSQVSLAQWDASLSMPPIGEYIDHSHNLVLDLMVWNGLPLGSLLVLLAACWFWTRFSRCRAHAAGWLYLGACGLLIHAQLEYPLDFAYFLIPFGLLLGAVDAMTAPTSTLTVGRHEVKGLAILFTAALTWIGVEFLQAEQAYRLFRLEVSKIGVPGIKTPPPDLQVLTQLGALMRFAQVPAREGMTTQELKTMRDVARRYGYSPSMLRYALAAALNRQPQEAADTLLRLCRVHPPARCEEGRESWASARARYPSIAVSFPTKEDIRGAAVSYRHDAPPVRGP